MKKLKKVTLMALLIMCISKLSSAAALEDYMIFKDGEKIVVMGQLSNNVIKKYNDASDAIQFAIDLHKESGGQVLVHKGTYLISKPIYLHNNISITGKGRSTKLLITKNNELGIGIIGKEVHGIQISNLKISAENEESVSGIVIEGCGDCKIRDLYIYNIGKFGIWVKNESFLCDISDCSLAGNKEANIYFDTHREGSFGDYIPNVVNDCKIYGGGKGIHCFNTTVLNIIGCVIYQTNDDAIFLDDVSCSVLISGCRTYQITGNAVTVKKSDELNITGNIFCWHTKHGIYLEDCAWGTITGNDIMDIGSFNIEADNFTQFQKDYKNEFSNFDGIHMKFVRGFSIVGNTLFNWPAAGRFRHGIAEDNECHHNTITSNTINYYNGEAVYSKGQDSNIKDNMIYNDLPYTGNPAQEKFQTFQKELTKKFINILD